MSLLFPQITKQLEIITESYDEIDEMVEQRIEAQLPQLIEQRLKEVSRIADPDPYNLHNIPIETRLAYIERYLIEGY